MINFICSLTLFASLCTPMLGALSILKPSQGGTGLGSATAGDVGKVIKVTDDDPFTFAFATDSEGSATFPFTPNSWGNSTSTVIGFTQGIISNASSTFSYLGDGLVGTNNGRLYGFASTSLFGFTPASNATTLAIAGTANQVTSSAGAQDLSANRTWTLSLPSHVIFPGNFFVNNSTTTNATTTGAVNLTTFTSALLQTDAEGDVAEYAGTSCTNQFPRSLSALGIATCATVGTADVAGLDISDDTNLTAGTGITLTGDDLSIDTSQNITTLSNLTGNGYVKTSGGNGTLGVQAVPIPVADGGTATTTWYDTGIAFYNSTLGTLSQASRATNHELVWDRTTPGLGIGSSTPWGLLSVNANGMGAGIPQLVVGSSTATNLIVASSGRVGVATTSPTSNFDFSVTGTGYFSSNTTIGGALTLGTDLSVANGGTGASTFTNNRVLTGNTASAIVDEANLTFDGTLLTVTGNLTTTGVIDFGGATSFELPNGTGPTVDTDGECAIDTTSGQLVCDLGTNVKVIGNGNLYPAFTYATSTAWTGTTTIPIGTAYVAETWNGVQCFTDTGTLNVSLYDGTNRMNMFNASTTVGTVTLSTNNTFTAAEKRYVDVGTPASSPTKISCTVDKGITAD